MKMDCNNSTKASKFLTASPLGTGGGGGHVAIQIRCGGRDLLAVVLRRIYRYFSYEVSCAISAI